MDKQKKVEPAAEQKKPKTPAPATPAATASKRPAVNYPAQQKVEAVLSVWTERRAPSEVCRELGIAWTILNQWQQRAMEGMLQALEPRVNLDRGPALSPRLRLMLQKKAGDFPLEKLAQRLTAAANPKEQPGAGSKTP